MGTWGSGPFDNDTAEDTLEELDAMSQRHREETVSAVFRSAVRGAGSPSASVLPEEVIVAAAVVAANTPAGARVEWNEDYPFRQEAGAQCAAPSGRVLCRVPPAPG